LHRFYRRTRGRRPEHQLLLQPVSGGFSLTEGSGPDAVVIRFHLADWSFREGKLPSLLGRFAVWSGSTVILGSLGVPTGQDSSGVLPIVRLNSSWQMRFSLTGVRFPVHWAEGVIPRGNLAKTSYPCFRMFLFQGFPDGPIS
jgi:hypothetical protein